MWFSELRRVLPRYPFLLFHYSYILCLTLFGSILVYTGGTKIDYVDALFLASSAATQAGLNTVDLNTLSIWQQFVLYGITMITVPVWINGAISFLRLYWFRKKFKYVIRKMRVQRHLRKEERKKWKHQIDLEDNGLRGRPIRVLLPHENVNNKEDDGVSNSTFRCPDGTTSATRSSMEIHETNINDSLSNGLYESPMSSTSGSRNDPNADDVPSEIHSDYAVNAKDYRSNDIEMDDLHPRLRRQASISSEGQKSSRTLQRGSTSSTSDKDFLSPPQNVTSYSDTNLLSHSRLPSNMDTSTVSIYSAPPVRNYGVHESDLSSSRSSLSGTNDDDDDEDEDRRSDPHIAFTNIHKPSRNQRREQKRTAKRRRSFYSHREESKHLPLPLRWNRSFSLHTRTLTFDRFLSNAFRRKREGSIMSGRSRRTAMSLPYLSYSPTVDRNSAFVTLTKEQRDELGGIEYRALKSLCFLILFYFVFLHLVIFIMFLVFAYTAKGSERVIESYGLKRGWWAFFTSASVFNDLGFTLTPTSFIRFNLNIFILLTSSFFIIAGNTGFPCLFRFVIWCFYCIVPSSSGKKEALAFLLDHPRRCFTLLFPSKATWWLVFILVILNAIDLLIFMLLDLNNSTIKKIPTGYRVVNALFQSICTRTAGFTSVTLSELHPAVLVSYMVMMYISVFPVAINMRTTNVYEERSLGIYSAEEDGNASFIGTHIRQQLSYDLWYIFLGLFILCICEGHKITDYANRDFTIFNLLFEVVSAYGTVGLSTGVSTANCSLSGDFCTVSKLVIIALQIRGRHRGLPRAVDRAIMLPSEKNYLKEEEDYRRRQQGGNRMSRTYTYSTKQSTMG
ncbi:potassium ion transporter Trk1 [Schizosaccharomyces japonicus yFS275]|uniref:Potassium transport protein n=1 Tax=Schizosaccharomyces japonicus (strain yFS275 / FY16936) TaxID=402676 RepID=B6K0G0_SCHJY|nr:potassium ion transporter Trk1 [Schizosaccharomyces japonicus yFS275]EEB06310.1 potassium ion transporter Trk1 [Schizosaccharomyces japonicus yFS275]